MEGIIAKLSLASDVMLIGTTSYRWYRTRTISKLSVAILATDAVSWVYPTGVAVSLVTMMRMILSGCLAYDMYARHYQKK